MGNIQVNKIIEKLKPVRDSRHLKSLEYALNSIFNCTSCSIISEIYLYGSFARGDYKYDSDIDILLKCYNDLSKENVLNIRRSINIEDYTLPEIDLKFMKEDTSISKHFLRNIEKECVLIWKR